MRQLELDFDAIPGVVSLAPYLDRHAMKNVGNRRADIAAFLLSRQRSTIQDVALRFKSLRGKKRLAFWNQTIADLREGLRQTSMSDAAIQRDLVAFRDAVEEVLSPSRKSAGAQK